jgi:hypothetical protein
MATRLWAYVAPTYWHDADEPPNVPYSTMWQDTTSADPGDTGFVNGVPLKALARPNKTLISQSHTNTEYGTYVRTANSGIAYPHNELGWSIVTVPLVGAQTISGDFRALFYARANSSPVASAQMRIKVVSNDGQTTRGVLLEGHTDSTVGSYGIPLGYSGTYQPYTFWFPRGLTDGTWATLSSVDAQDGDRIVIEVGARLFSFTTTTEVWLEQGGHPDATVSGYDRFHTPDPLGSSGLRSNWLEFSQDLNLVGQLKSQIDVPYDGWAGLHIPATTTQEPILGQVDLDVQDVGYIIELRNITGTLDVDVQDVGYLVLALSGTMDVAVDLVTDTRQIKGAPLTVATLPTNYLDPVLFTQETFIRFNPITVSLATMLAPQVDIPITVPAPRPTQPGEIPEAPGTFGPPVVGGIDIRALYGITVTMTTPVIENGQPT